MCAPSSVGAIEPEGITNASTTNARKTKARMKATRIDSIVSLIFSFSGGAAVLAAGAGDGGGVTTGGMKRGGEPDAAGTLFCGWSIMQQGRRRGGLPISQQFCHGECRLLAGPG